MSEEYDYNYMTMWIEPYIHNNSIINNCENKDLKSNLKSNLKSDSKSDSKSNLKSESIIDTYISSEPEYIYEQWKMIWN
jgi:hypothetical protein